MKKRNLFIYNTLILVSVSLIMRTVAMYFNIYVSNTVGAEAMGVYSLIGGVYGFGITLATSGINLAVTRLISEAQGKRKEYLNPAIMKTCILYALSFGALACVLLIALSEKISYSLLDDKRCVIPLRILALSLPLLSVTSAMNGYFTARRTVIKNAATVFIEQGVRISISIILLTHIIPKGIEYACISLAIGATAAEISSFIIMVLLYKFRKKEYVSFKKTDASFIKPLIGISLPIAFSSYARSGLVTLEHALIPVSLKKYGTESSLSLALYGSLHSMAMPVVLFPAILITSFSGLLIPEIAESTAAGNTERTKSIQRHTMRLTLAFSICVSGILMCFSKQAAMLLYPDTPSAGNFIFLLSPLIPVMYFDTMTDVMLKGIGEQLYSMIVNILDASLSVLLVWLAIPKFGIYSYIVTIYICEIVNMVLSVSRLLTKSKVRFNICGWLVKPCLSCAGAMSVSEILVSFLHSGFTPLSLAFMIILYVCVYILLLRGLYAFDGSDIKKIKDIINTPCKKAR